MWSIVRNGYIAGVATMFITAGCGLKTESGTSTSSYNNLLTEYNALLKTSYALQTKSEAEETQLQDLDDSLQTFSTKAEKIRSMANSLDDTSDPNAPAQIAAELTDLNVQMGTINTKLSKLEQSVLAQVQALADNAPNVYSYGKTKQSSLTQEKTRLNRKSRILTGVASLVAQERNSTFADASLKLRLHAASLGVKAPTVPAPQIKETKRDTEVKSVARGSRGFVRDSRNQVIALSTKQEIVDFARANGINENAASDAYEICFDNGGAVSFAPNKANLPNVISDTVSHFKPTLNANFDDLELAFVIDYSGSMSDDIEAVIKGLVDIVKEMENIRSASRNVKIAIVTFGEPGKEKVELDLTSDLTAVRETLTNLLALYPRNQHSTDPGEASYHGMNIAADKIKWSSRNRMSIVITDEEAYEIRTGDRSYVNAVNQKLSNKGIQNHIYTILVR